MTAAQPPESDAAAAGAEIELTGDDEPGGRHKVASDAPLTTHEQSQEGHSRSGPATPDRPSPDEHWAPCGVGAARGRPHLVHRRNAPTGAGWAPCHGWLRRLASDRDPPKPGAVTLADLASGWLVELRPGRGRAPSCSTNAIRTLWATAASGPGGATQTHTASGR